MSTFPDLYSKISRLLELQVSELLPPPWWVLADLPRAASTGPAFEPPLLVSDGPTAALNPGETSCLPCETRYPAAKTQRQKSNINLYRNSRRAVTVRWSSMRHSLQGHSLSHLLHSYWLLLAEEKTAKLGIGSRVWEAEYGALGRGLCDLVGWSAADRLLLVSWSGCSHCHLKESLRCLTLHSLHIRKPIQKSKIPHKMPRLKIPVNFD